MFVQSEMCRKLRSETPQLQGLMLTSFSDDHALFDAVMAGADGQSLLDTHTTSALLARLRRDQAQRTDPRAILSGQEQPPCWPPTSRTSAGRDEPTGHRGSRRVRSATEGSRLTTARATSVNCRLWLRA